MCFGVFVLTGEMVHTIRIRSTSYVGQSVQCSVGVMWLGSRVFTSRRNTFGCR